jgi:hypothetical protein
LLRVPILTGKDGTGEGSTTYEMVVWLVDNNDMVRC